LQELDGKIVGVIQTPAEEIQDGILKMVNGSQRSFSWKAKLLQLPHLCKLKLRQSLRRNCSHIYTTFCIYTAFQPLAMEQAGKSANGITSGTPLFSESIDGQFFAIKFKQLW